MPSWKISQSLDGIYENNLNGFFQGWPTSPNPKTHLTILQNAKYRAIATHAGSHQVIGFVYALTDGILSAYIPLLEVRPEFRKLGIGKCLVMDLLVQLQGYYMIDVCCDEEVIPFYQKLGFTRIAAGMVRRDYSAQGGLSYQTSLARGINHDGSVIS
jgi:ribosomal protein S18 acetylase RimI-like enzyme